MIVSYLPYTLTLRAPALLTSTSGDPNTSQTLTYIPGSAIRGAAARNLGDPGDDSERLRRFRNVILDGKVRFLNAYPRAAGRRTLPAPVSLRTKKHGVEGAAGEVTALDLAAFTGEPDEDGPLWPEASLETVAEPFITVGAAQQMRVAPVRVSRIHQQRDRSFGRAWTDTRNGREEAHGAIFAFAFLEAGQDFEGQIQVVAESQSACDALVKTVQRLLGDSVLLGRSRRGGYGGNATISWDRSRSREVDGQGLVNTDLPAGTEFRALLTSACIARNPNTGQIEPSHVADDVVDRLGGRATVVARRWSFERLGGFNSKWRLPVPQALACAAGSVLVLRTTATIPLSDLIAVENAGLGERRVEGFGRVVFLQAASKRPTLRLPTTSTRVAPTGTPPELVHYVQQRILDSALERNIEQEAARVAQNARPVPTPSLLGRLRTAMRAEPQAALVTLQTWFAGEGPHRLSDRQWTNSIAAGSAKAHASHHGCVRWPPNKTTGRS